MELKKNDNLMEGKGEWDESEHPRDNEGKFTDKENSQTSNKKQEKTFEQQVDEVLKGTYKGAHIVICEETPKILQEIGMPNKPILMTSKHAYLSINKTGKYKEDLDHYHNLGKDLFLLLPKYLEKPILGFQSIKNSDDIICIINAIDKQKNPILIPIKINGKGNRNYIEVEANIMKSAYGKNNLNRYLNKNLTSNNLLFVENKKIRNLS